MFITSIHIFSFLDVENDKHTVLFFLLSSSSSMVKERLHFFCSLLCFLNAHIFMLYNLTYICPLARLLVEQHQQQTERGKKRRTKKKNIVPFSLRIKRIIRPLFFSLFYHRTIIPKNCSLSVEVHFFLLRPHYRRCRTLLLVTSNKLTMGNQLFLGKLTILSYIFFEYLSTFIKY